MSVKHPSKLLQEIQECMEDLLPDYNSTFLDFDADTARVARNVAIEAFKQGKNDPERGLKAITAMFLWWFLLGREHATRGYKAPIRRSESTEGLVPDTVGGDWSALETELRGMGIDVDDLLAGLEPEDDEGSPGSQ